MNFYCVKCGVNYPPGERCLCKPEASPTPKPSCEMQLLASIEPKPEGARDWYILPIDIGGEPDVRVQPPTGGYFGSDYIHVVERSALTTCEAKLAEMVQTARQAQDMCFKQHAELMAERDAYAGMKLAWQQERARADRFADDRNKWASIAGDWRKERDRYAKAMAIALREGIFADKARVKREIEAALAGEDGDGG